MVAEGADEPAGGCRPGDARERPGVDADMGHLFLKRGQVAIIYKAENIQEAQHGERLTQVPESMMQFRFGFLD